MTDMTISVKDKLIKKIKKEAGRRIIDVLPEWKQRNLTARGLQLMNLARINGGLTAEQELESVEIDNVWETLVVPIRAHSDKLESDVNNGVQIDIENSWP